MLNSVGRVPSWVSWISCYRAIVPSWYFVSISWVQNIILLVLRGSIIFPRGYCVGQKCSPWVFRGSKYFSRWYLVVPRFFLVGSTFSLVGNFVIFSSWRHEKKSHINISETAYSFSNQSQQL